MKLLVSDEGNCIYVRVYTVLHCHENPIYVFLFWELRGLSPNFHINVSVSDLYIYSQDRSTHFLQSNRQIDRWNIYKSLTDT
jgi:hypothetical protein